MKPNYPAAISAFVSALSLILVIKDVLSKPIGWAISIIGMGFWAYFMFREKR